ncbi:MAG: acyl-ACP--UDP-N-acetylglucosamine O-acyltransferase [Cyanobacteria bacterium P01_H01_bin.15]
MDSRIHATAIVDPQANLDPSVMVGPYAVIGPEVTVGARTRIGAHVVIEGPTEIGTDNQIFVGAAIGLEPQDLKFKGASSWVKIGNHNLIREYVTINRATGEGEATVLGDHILLMAYSHVAHNCTIEDNVIIANNVAIAGHVRIEAQARLSGVLGVHQFVQIGRMAMIGGMSKITRDVPPFALVDGNPALIRSLHEVGLKRFGTPGTDLAELRQAFKLLYRSDLTFGEALEQLPQQFTSSYVSHLQQFLKGSISGRPRRGVTPYRRVRV